MPRSAFEEEAKILTDEIRQQRCLATSRQFRRDLLWNASGRNLNLARFAEAHAYV